MASPERKISVVPPHNEPPSVEARLARLEEEGARLRAEVATLQDEVRWLTDEDAYDGEPALLSHGWLTRGWVRASMLMTVVALVAFVSVPYLLHLLDASPHQADPVPGAASSAVAPVTPPVAVPAPKATARAYIPSPARGHAAEVPEPVYVRANERRSAAPRPAARRDGAEPPDTLPSVPLPVRGESP